MRRFKKWAFFLILLYVSLTVLAYNYQERLIFFPSKIPLHHTFDFCQDHDEIFLKTEDGAELNAVHIKQPESKGIVIYFHGNSGNVSHLTHVANLFSSKGYASLLVDYRSYGKSTGKLSEEALYNDAQLFYDYILESYEEKNIVIYGRSFGTGIATWLAANNNPLKVILESPFYSAVALGSHRFPFLPVKWLSRYRFPSNTYVKEITCPIYIFHGAEDEVIPYASAKKLYESIATDRKKLFSIKDGGHNYLQDFEVFKKGMAEALD